MSRTASKTANVYTRIDPTVKNSAEEILSALGIPMSNAVEMFLRQVIIQRGIPFDVKVSNNVPLSLGSLTKEKFDKELQKGVDDIDAGHIRDAEDVEKNLREEFGL